VSTVTYKNEEGLVMEATLKEEMEEVAMKANTHKKIPISKYPFYARTLSIGSRVVRIWISSPRHSQQNIFTFRTPINLHPRPYF
jgi:hypothetical protein